MRTRSAPSPRLVGVAYWVGVVAILASYLWACSGSGFRYPPPWPDESIYMWSAVSIQRDTSLLAPQLNPERPFLGMMPGYMIIQGLIFKLTGFSFQWARTLSGLYVVGGVCLLSMLFRRSRYPFASLLFCAVFLHSPIALMVGNVARMEGLVFLLMSAGLLLLQRERLYIGLAVISLLPLIHANGSYLVLGGAAYWLCALLSDKGKCKPSRLDLLAIGAALLPWLLYLAYVSTHWEPFLYDMNVSLFARPRSNFIGIAASRLQERTLAIPGLLIIGAALTACWRNRPALIILVCAGPLFLLSATSQGWPYEFYLAIMYLLASVLLVEAVSGQASTASWSRFGTSRRIPAVVLVLLVAGANAWAFRNEERLSSSVRAATTEGAASSPIPYVTDSDRRAVRAFLRRQVAEDPVTIIFFPEADALFFADLENEKLRFVQPMSHYVQADIVILHESRHLPDWVSRGNRSRAKHNQGVKHPVHTWRLLHERDDTERWRAAATRPWWSEAEG